MPNLNGKLLTKKHPGVTQGLPPGKEDLAWVTNTVTLIYGERDAVLVDTFLSVQHSKELVDWLVESGKNLTAIYITHAHGDHFFGLKLLLDRFPDAKAFATSSVVAAMQSQIEPDVVRSFWEPRFPGQVPSELVVPEVLEGDTLYLEGEKLDVMHLGHTDTSDTTALHVPSIGLVVSGDAVYNNTHPYLAECDEKARSEWLSALERIEALHPRTVIAGHGVLDPDSSPRHGNKTLHLRFEWHRGKYFDGSRHLREDAGVASEPRESRFALGHLKCSEAGTSPLRNSTVLVVDCSSKAGMYRREPISPSRVLESSAFG